MANLDIDDWNFPETTLDSEERLEIDVEFVWKLEIDALSSVNIIK